MMQEIFYLKNSQNVITLVSTESQESERVNRQAKKCTEPVGFWNSHLVPYGDQFK